MMCCGGLDGVHAQIPVIRERVADNVESVRRHEDAYHDSRATVRSRVDARGIWCDLVELSTQL